MVIWRQFGGFWNIRIDRSCACCDELLFNFFLELPKREREKDEKNDLQKKRTVLERTRSSLRPPHLKINWGGSKNKADETRKREPAPVACYLLVNQVTWEWGIISRAISTRWHLIPVFCFAKRGRISHASLPWVFVGIWLRADFIKLIYLYHKYY